MKLKSKIKCFFIIWIITIQWFMAIDNLNIKILFLDRYWLVDMVKDQNHGLIFNMIGKLLVKRKIKYFY